MLVRCLYVVICLLPGCQFFKRDQEPESKVESPPESLVAKGDGYCNLSKPAYDLKGYVHSKCDGAGFTSLYSVRCTGVDLSVFTDEAGKLWRDKTRDCFPNKESESESSRDMLLMRMVAAWRARDLDWVTKAWGFVDKNHGDICEASTPAYKLGRCTMTPQLTALLKALKDKLEGETPLRLELQLEKEGEGDGIGLPVHSDFEAHIDVLRIWLSGEVYGAITQAEKDLLMQYAARESRNALFQAVWGLYSDQGMGPVWEILGTWPVDRLPSTQDWKEPYLWQRSMAVAGSANPDWLPVDGPPIPHDGADYNMALDIASGGK